MFNSLIQPLPTDCYPANDERDQRFVRQLTLIDDLNAMDTICFYTRSGFGRIGAVGITSGNRFEYGFDEADRRLAFLRKIKRMVA